MLVIACTRQSVEVCPQLEMDGIGYNHAALAAPQLNQK